MAKYRYALEKDQSKLLEIDLNVRNSIIELDGIEILTVSDLKSLQKGMSIALPDGSNVDVILKSTLFGFDLVASRNGVHLEGSTGDPLKRLKSCCQILFLVAIGYIFFGVLVTATKGSYFTDLRFGWPNIVLGLVFLMLGFFSRRKSKPALIIAIVIYALTGIYSLAAAFTAITPLTLISLIIQVLFLIIMIPGVKAIEELKKCSNSGADNVEH
jgi:hypothetical protein